MIALPMIALPMIALPMIALPMIALPMIALPMFPDSNPNDIGGVPVHIIRGPGHKHKKRKRQDDEKFVSLFEFVQEAITREYPWELPPLTDVRNLTKKVRETVSENYEWLAKGHDKPKISQDTVRRALRALRKL
jgi:hypothetical protein